MYAFVDQDPNYIFTYIELNNNLCLCNFEDIQTAPTERYTSGTKMKSKVYVSSSFIYIGRVTKVAKVTVKYYQIGITIAQ